MKQIRRPSLSSAKPLGAMDLNNIHFDKRHTVLTPALLEASAKTAKGS